MIKITFFIIVFGLINYDTLCQVDYTVGFDNRNKAIKLTNDARLDIKEKKAEDALNKLLEAIAIDSNYREAYLQLYQAGTLNVANSGKVMKELLKGKRIFEEDDELYFYCGEIYRLNSDFEKAILEYGFAMEYAKKNGEDFYLVPYYYLNRGNLYLKKNQFDKALQDYNYSLKLKPDFLGSITNRGICFFKLGKKEDACKDWKNAMDKGFEPAKDYYNKHCSK